MGTRAYVLVGIAEVTLGVGVDGRVIGYTTDGVTMNLRSDYYDAKVDENVGTILRRLTDQEITVSLNMAEGTLENLASAIPGSGLDGNVLTIGSDVLQEHRLTLRGTDPAGYERVIVLTRVNPTGEVAVPYKKGEASIVPVTFSALVEDDMTFGEVIDAIEIPPTLEEEGTKSTDEGDIIEAKFSKSMAAPTGKHDEFWFTEVGDIRTFDEAALKEGADDTIELTVSGETPIAEEAELKLYYLLGTVMSADGGVLRSFENQPVEKRPAGP